MCTSVWSLGLWHVVGAGVLAVAAGLIGAVQVVADDGRPAAAAAGIQHQVLGQHLGLKLPAFRQGLQLASHRVQVVGGQARIDRLGVFLQDPDRAAGLAQEMHRFARLAGPDGVAPDQARQIGVLELGDHLGPGHVADPVHIDTMKVDRVSGGDLDLVHHPEAPVVERSTMST